MKSQRHILPIIVLAQFMCTSLWFAGNAVMPQLINHLNLSTADLGYVTSSVQFGFIVGTLVYSIFTIADRFNASNVFLMSALLGALFNLLISLSGSFAELITFRFLTGFFLAGIYPVGMKIASDFFKDGLGKALSFLVGALVLGTALPHLIASYDNFIAWEFVLYTTSSLAVIGGIIIKFFIGEGPYHKKSQEVKFSAMRQVFKDRSFRSAAFGYFGHMWELYAFWAFVPVMLGLHSGSNGRVSFHSFLVIGLGAIACFIGGFISDKYGTKKMAIVFLGLSGICCLASPLMYGLNYNGYLIFLIFWGMVVIADSPLFSTLVAQHADPKIKGTALTIVTSVGFAITIGSLQLLVYLLVNYDQQILFLPLVIGPVLGLIALIKRPTSASS
ncbi:MFS transporter [Ekhidna sp.]|uniref:MFS transporter n=1 Tax=Ekhidna sp. TaxID=2608089 RepID=UPI003B50EAD1